MVIVELTEDERDALVEIVDNWLSECGDSTNVEESALRKLRDAKVTEPK